MSTSTPLPASGDFCRTLHTVARAVNSSLDVMQVYTSTQHEFSEAELELVESIASLSALAIEHGRLYERLNRDYQVAVAFNDRVLN
jgi:hypothetical protein